MKTLNNIVLRLTMKTAKINISENELKTNGNKAPVTMTTTSVYDCELLH